MNRLSSHIARTCFAVFCLFFAFEARAARDAAFLAPAASLTKGSEQAIGIEPKNEIDLGDTIVNVGRRTTFFFVNLSSTPIEIVSIMSTGDSIVKTEIVGDDCTKQGKIAVGSRCSVAIETTPLGSGTWTAELLLTHNGAGRLARARLSGRTGGAMSSEKKEMGLELSSKDIKPVDFGEVEVGSDKAVRTALMVNDSNENITISSVEVIAAENGLKRLDQGCMTDSELKPGESCPVTLVWYPVTRGIVSTDLIIRHSGKRGFSVIPVRGKALAGKGGGASDGIPESQTSSFLPAGSTAASSSRNVSLSPTAEEMERALAGAMPSLPEKALGLGDTYKSKAAGARDLLGKIHLIGTVGNRAVLYCEGETFVAGLGEKFERDDKTIELVNVTEREAEISVDGKRKKMSLEAISALTEQAGRESAQRRESDYLAIRKPSSKQETSKAVSVSSGNP